MQPTSAYLFSRFIFSKLVSSVSLITRCAQIFHSQDLDNQARPARKVLRPLTLAGLGIVLLPSEARLLPAVVHCVDEVLAESCVEIPSLGFVRTFLKSKILKIVLV